jgi:CheY-like chemotaxis protein
MQKKPLIMVVDDSPLQAYKLCQLLNKQGYSTVEVHSGEEALLLLEQELPAIVYTDIMMPGMDGYQLCAAIRASGATQNTPVILLTSLSDPKDVLRAIECRADYFFSKPYNEEYLISRTADILQTLHLRQVSPTKQEKVVVFGNDSYTVKPDLQRVIDLLISTYEASVLVNNELIRTQRKLSEQLLEVETALQRIKHLEGVIPICMYCKQIRDDENSWHKLENYISEHSDAVFSHGICPNCYDKTLGEYKASMGQETPK